MVAHEEREARGVHRLPTSLDAALAEMKGDAGSLLLFGCVGRP